MKLKLEAYEMRNHSRVMDQSNIQRKKTSDITMAAFLFSSHPKRERDREAHLNYYASAYNGEDNYRTARLN